MAPTCLREIEFGNVTFPVGATVDSKFDYQIAKLTYSYSLLRNQNVDLAVAAGVYTAFYDFRSTDIETGATEGEDGTAPVPVFGLRGAFLINSRWMANAYLEYFEIDNSDVDAMYIAPQSPLNTGSARGPVLVSAITLSTSMVRTEGQMTPRTSTMTGCCFTFSTISDDQRRPHIIKIGTFT